MDILYENHNNLMSQVSDSFFRYLMDTIEWNQRMLAMTRERMWRTKLLLLPMPSYRNKSVYNLAPGSTLYFSRSVMPACANTSSSIKKLPVQVSAGRDKI